VAKAEVLPLTEADIPGILPIIRQADRDEIEGALQIDLSTAIADGLSDCCKASKIVVDGHVVAIFGDTAIQRALVRAEHGLELSEADRAALREGMERIEKALKHHDLIETRRWIAEQKKRLEKFA
jgi:hypothetical protein